MQNYASKKPKTPNSTAKTRGKSSSKTAKPQQQQIKQQQQQPWEKENNNKSWNTNVILKPPPPDRKFPFATQERLEIDETGKQFQITPFMSNEQLQKYLLNQDDFQNKNSKKWIDIQKIAEKIGMESLEDMMDNDDILLDGLRAPPGWLKIQYVKSKQKFYWNEETKERLKSNPDLPQLREEFLYRKNNQCIILPPIQPIDLQQFWVGLDDDTPLDSINIPEDKNVEGIEGTSTLAIIKKVALELGMTKVKQMKKQMYQNILLKALNPNENWQRVIYVRQGAVGYFNPKIQERSDIHPQIQKLKIEFENAKKLYNYEPVREVGEKELIKYFDTSENKYDKCSAREKQVIQEVQIAAKQLGMENKDDQQNYKDILLELLRSPEGFKKVQYDDTGKICYLNLFDKHNHDTHPLLSKLKKKLADSKQALVRKQEKIAEDRVQGLYAGEFQEETVNAHLKQAGNGAIQVKKNADNKTWKVAAFQPELIKDSVRRFSIFINKMYETGKMCIGICQQEILEEQSHYLDIRNPCEGTYMITAEGAEIIEKKQETEDAKFTEHALQVKNNYEQLSVQDRFTYKQGDEIIVEVDLSEKIINYFNRRTNKTYVQRVRRLDEEFSLSAAMLHPLDEIKIEPRCNFPIHFVLTWQHTEVDLDLHLTCACGNEISFKSKKCKGCLTYLDKDHLTGENAIEHIFIRNLPKTGQTWKYSVFYYEDHTDEKIAKNIDYSVSVISVDQNENFRTLQRRDGFLGHEEDETFFEFTYTSEIIEKTQKQSNNNNKNNNKIVKKIQAEHNLNTDDTPKSQVLQRNN